MTKPQYAIGEHIEFVVVRTEPNFDRACEDAYERAFTLFGGDDDGYLEYVRDWERSTDSLCVKFVGYQTTGGMNGVQHAYTFEAWIERSEE